MKYTIKQEVVVLWLFKSDGAITFWEEGFHPEEVYTKEFFDIKQTIFI